MGVPQHPEVWARENAEGLGEDHIGVYCLGRLLEMETPESPSLHVVARKKAGRVLINLGQQRYVLPFLTRDCTVNEAAERTQTSLNSMYARVQRFVRLGLLHVRETRACHGRAVKVYRSVADRFFIPALLLDFETVEAAQASHDGFWERELRRSLLCARMDDTGEWGFELYRDERGDSWVHGANRPGERYDSGALGTPATVNLWSEQITLNYKDAKAFQDELLALYRKYHVKRGSQSYLLRIGLAPRQSVWPE